MLSPRALVALPLLVACPAHADPVRDAIQLSHDAQALGRSLDTILDVAYALSNPDELWIEATRAYGELLNDPVAAAMLANLMNQYRGGYVGIDVTAGITSDLSTPVAGNIAVDAAYQLPLCRVLGVNATGLGGYADGDALASWSLGGTACLPLPADTIQVSYTHRENVRTSLFARPVVLTDRVTDDLVNIDVRPYRWLGEHNQVEVLPFDIDIDVSRDSETSGFGTQLVTLDMAPTRWRRRGKGLAGADQTYDFLKVHVLFEDDDESIGGRSSQIDIISPLAIDGIHLGPDVAFGADVGYLRASTAEANAAPLHLVTANAAHTELWVGTAITPFSAELRATHTILPTYDGQLVRDNRLAARMQIATPQYSARTEGFLGREELLRKEPGGTTLGIAGGAADVAYAASRHLHIVGRIEAARTLAASRAVDPVVSQWDVRATIGLTTQLSARYP